jgi:hypothetical protein
MAAILITVRVVRPNLTRVLDEPALNTGVRPERLEEELRAP